MHIDDQDHYRKTVDSVMRKNNIVIENYDEYLLPSKVSEIVTKLSPKRKEINTKKVHALLDVETNRIFCVSTKASTIIALKKTLNSWTRFNMATTSFPIKFDASTCWMYVQQKYSLNMDKNVQELSADRVYKFLLTEYRCQYLDEIHSFISNKRISFNKDLAYQSIIYQEKYNQAKEIISLDLLEDKELDYPYVTTYATIMNCSLIDAARDIVFQYKSNMYKNADLERVRLEYCRNIMMENDISLYPSIMNNFYKELEIYANI